MNKQTNPPAGGQTDKKKLDVWGWVKGKPDDKRVEEHECCGGGEDCCGGGCCGDQHVEDK